MITCNISLDLKSFGKNFKSLVKEISKILDLSELLREYLRGLRLLKSLYSNIVTDDEFFDGISKILKGLDMTMLMNKKGNEQLKSVLLNPDGSINTYLGDLSTYDPYFVESTLDIKSKFDSFDTTPSEENDKQANKDLLIAQYFPMSSDARLAFELRFKKAIIERFFFNGDENIGFRVNMSNSQMDKSVKEYRKELELFLDNFVLKKFPNDYNTFKLYSINSKLIYFSNALNNGNFSVSPIELIKIASLDVNSDLELKDKLLAYMAYIALKHYDELIGNAFGDSITIVYKNDYDTDKVKYRINLGNRSATTWNDDSKDIDETELIGSVIRLYMESLDMYDPKNGKHLPIKLSFSDVKSGLGGIMNLFNLTSGNNLLRNYKLDSLSDPKNTLIQAGIKKFYKEGFDDIYKEYVKGKTLGQLIAATKRDPALLAPLLFNILALNNENFFEQRYLTRLAVYSMWKNIFDLNNPQSLLNRTMNSGGINLDAADLYSFVTVLFVNVENIPVIEYKKDTDGSTSIIELQENTANSRLNSQKYTWAGKYNAERPQQFNSFVIDDFIGENTSTKVTLNNYDMILNLSASDGKVLVDITDKNGKEIVDVNDLDFEVLDFLSEVFDKKLDKDYLNLFKSIGGQSRDLLKLAGTILYNYKVGKVVQSKIKEDKKNDSSKSLKLYYDEELEKFYPENAPSAMRDSLQPELFDKSIYPTVKRYSLALDILSGYSGDTVAKDGFGKLIALKGLSSLMSKYMELVYNLNLGDPDSILKDFSIYNTYENAYFVRDYSSMDTKKLSTQFSEAEFFAASFLYDFYSGQVAVNNGVQSDLRGENSTSESPTKFYIMGPVVSDKNKLPKLLFDWRSEVTLPNGEVKRYLDLTPDEILDILEKEFGTYYEKVHERILLDWNNLQPYIQKYIPGVIVDFDNDFELFNLLCKEKNEDPFNVIHKAIADYLVYARQNGLNDLAIKITVNFHYIEGKDKEIHNNPSLFHQLNIYGKGVPFKVRNERTIENPDGTKITLNKGYLPNLDVSTINETPELARERLKLQLISELLLNNIVLHFGDKDSNTKDNSSFAAELFNEEDVWRKGKTIYYGKIIGDTKEINLYNLNSFKNWKKYNDLVETFGNDLPEDLNINSPKFNLLKTLNVLTTIKKFRTLQTTSAKRLLIPEYLKSLQKLLEKSSYQELIKAKYLRDHPTWKPETIEKKYLEKFNSFENELQILEYLIKDIIDLEVNKYVRDFVINGIKPSEKFNLKYRKFNQRYKFITDNIESLDPENEDDKRLIDRLNSSDYNIEINPEVERYLNLNNWLGESYMLTSVGTFISHPGNKDATTIYNYEYGNFGQQVKRNVSLTATKHREVQNSLKGIRQRLRVAFVQDKELSIITYKGDYDKKGVDVHNGATWYNGTMVDLDNNSLGADAMGLDKKPFTHAIDPKTGCAIIIKTAGFAITNKNIQGSRAFARLNKLMNHVIKWTDTLRRNGDNRTYFNWLEGFDGKRLNIKEWYVLKGDSFYKYSDPKIDENGYTTIKVAKVDKFGLESFSNDYTFGYYKGLFVPIRKVNNKYVTFDGTTLDSNPVFQPVNSNWELWNVFGGAYSAHFNEDKILTSINDNGSFLKLNYVMNHTGIVKNPNLPTYSLSNVFQVIKESQIDMIPTMEAGKFGASNINDTRLFDDDNYFITYMEVEADDFGEQLDAEHSAEGGHVSLMTLVVNALGARGYSKQAAEECYEALELLAEQAFEDSFELLKLLNEGRGSLEEFKMSIANIMLQTFKNASISDGNILSALSLNLKNIQSFNNTSLLEGVFPLSSPLIYAKAFSKFASALEKSSVRLKFDGGMMVLNPSDSLVQLIGNDIAGNVPKSKVELLQLNAYNNPLTSTSLIRFGKNYYIIRELGEQTPLLVDSLEDFYTVKNAIELGVKVVEAFQEGLVETEDNSDLNNPKKKAVFNYYKPLGRDLATYDCTIGILGSNKEINLYETDVVRQLFNWDNKNKIFKESNIIPLTNLELYWNQYFSGHPEVEPLLIQELNRYGINTLDPNRMKDYLQNNFLLLLNSTSSDGVKRNILVDGQELKIDKNKTKVSPYEAVLPMIYKTTFGLEEGDSIDKIESDEYFFVKRFIKNCKSKFNNNGVVNGWSFDLELKKTSGDHIYLAHPSRKQFLTQTIEIIPEIVGDVMYRVDTNGNRMYQIPSKIDERTGKLVPNCKILKATNGAEIILTNDFSTILESENYNSISFGNFSKAESYLQNILTQLEKSDNKIAKAKAKHVLNTVNRRVKNAKEGVQNGIAKYNIIANDEELSNALFEAPDLYNSIAEIFSDKFGKNSFQHSELYTQDATNLDEKLLELEEAIQTGTLNSFITEDSYYDSVIKYGLELHTSFLMSLEAVVSRTPAQSHQSFMAMKVAAFDSGTVNSIYVNRMLLFLQGSDFDIDKANLLGLKFLNGRLIIWSPYFDLTSKERAEASETLPFPTGKSILIKEDSDRLPFDVIEKDYSKQKYSRTFINGIEEIEVEGDLYKDNNGNIITVHEYNGIHYIETLLNGDGLNQNTYLLQHAILNNLGKKAKIIEIGLNPTFDKDVFSFSQGRDETIKFTGNINTENDIRLYLNSLDISSDDNGDYNNLKDLGILIRTISKLGYVPSNLQYVKDIVDAHNLFFRKSDGTRDNRKDKKKRNALYNFISIKTKNISKDPINLIQGQSGIDVATGVVKALVKPGAKFDRLSSMPVTSDNRSILARMHQLVLTLTGKENVGIVASAMKVFEAMSHHYNKTLSEGSLEEQKRLLSKISIMGKKLPLIANSYTKNRDTLKSNKILESYNSINNFEDAFIMMSALLSLATDNAKDPTLSKLNATPETIGCYTAGLVLGLTIEDVAELLISDTGILLANMVKGNVFNPGNNLFRHLSDAISFIRNIPDIPTNNKDLNEALTMFGLWTPENDKDEPDFREILWSPRKRKRFKQLAMYMLHSDSFELETDLNKIAKRNLNDIKNNPYYWGWTEEKQLEYKEATGDKKTELEKEYKEYLSLAELKESYEEYLLNPESNKAKAAKEEVLKILELNTKNSSKENKARLKALMNSTLGVKEALENVFEWLNYRDIIESDKIEKDGISYSILEQIRKLNSFNEEMGDLRSVLKLNQGLPNSVLEQLNWIGSFRNLLNNAIRRTNRKIKDESNTPLAEFKRKYGSLDLDLNLFLNNPEYQKDAILAYDSTKIGVNILDVMLGVPHYRGYMKTMNLLYEGSKIVSTNYKTLSEIALKVLPKLSLKSVDLVERFYKTLNPVIFERINNDFLWQELAEYEIPKFDIVDGELIEQKGMDGEILTEKIRLGTKNGNNKFKDYCLHYLYPYLTKNYPDNAFVQAITTRTYGYNLDHQISVNIAKRQSYNMNNPTENTQFNEIKKALMELNGVDGIVRSLFYYNLIAYNGLPGTQSLTDLFEDFLIYDNNKVITDYLSYITYIDESEISLFDIDKVDEDYLLKVFAPKVFQGDDVSNMKYIWITNPENNKDILMKYVGQPTEEEIAAMEAAGYNPYENELNDDDYEDYSRYNPYKTLLDIKEKWLKGEWVEVDLYDETSSEKQNRFIIGKEIILNSDIILEEIKNEKYKGKRISQLTDNLRRSLIKSVADLIYIIYNGNLISLLKILEGKDEGIPKILKENGWTKEDILDMFLYVTRKSKNYTYDILETSKLKSRLEHKLNNLKNSC